MVQLDVIGANDATAGGLFRYQFPVRSKTGYIVPVAGVDWNMKPSVLVVGDNVRRPS